MKREEIVQLLYGLNLRPSTIARCCKVSPPVVTNSMDGRGSRSVRLKIARTLCRPPSHIWVKTPRSQILLDDDVYYHPELYPELTELEKGLTGFAAVDL